jgi:hypothetical protein
MSWASREAYAARKERVRIRRHRPLVVGAISGRALERRWHRLRGAPGVVRLQTGGGNLSLPLSTSPSSKPRQRITGFSEPARRRFRVRANEIMWPRRRLALVTLTYPRHFDADPLIWKGHLFAWRKRFERQYGPILYVWAMEFQRRGAPHFHLALVLPNGWRLTKRELLAVADGRACRREGRPSVKEFRAWNARAWYEIAGHGDERHLIQHSKEGHCKPARGPRGLTGYLLAELGKKSQKELPDWLVERMEGAGRWWGICGKLHRGILDDRLTPRESQILRRLMSEQLRRRRGAPRARVSRGHSYDSQHRHVMLFDRSKRDWTLYYELKHYLAMIRGPAVPRGSFADLYRRSAMQLELVAA